MDKKFKTITTSTGGKTNNDEILKLQKKNKELEQEVEILKKRLPYSQRNRWQNGIYWWQ